MAPPSTEYSQIILRCRDGNDPLVVSSRFGEKKESLSSVETRGLGKRAFLLGNRKRLFSRLVLLSKRETETRSRGVVVDDCRMLSRAANTSLSSPFSPSIQSGLDPHCRESRGLHEISRRVTMTWWNTYSPVLCQWAEFPHLHRVYTRNWATMI